MANINLARGGAYRYESNYLAPHQVYGETINRPAARIAGEYMHGFFTAGASFNPLNSIGQAEALRKANVKVGDYLDLFVIPEHHTIVDVAALVIPMQHERGYFLPPNSDGLVFTLEAHIIDAKTLAHEGDVDLVDPMTGITANTHMMKRTAVKPANGGYFVPTGKAVKLVLKVEGLPTDKFTSIADVTSRVEVSAHVFDYEVPMHL